MTGTTVVHYRIGERIGAGGMGVVYRATDTRLGRDVAIKFLPDPFADAAARERFQREARAASVLNHAGICTVFDVGEHEGRPFLVMELLEGQTLRSRIAARPLTPEEWLDFALQGADALAAAHAKNVIHRDIKSSNVFVTADARVKLLDFGLAKIHGAATARASSGDEATLTADLTVAGTTLGTVSYMSPEQARGEAADARSDVFSFGVILYEMATGQLPFTGPTDAAVFAALLERAAIKPSQVRPGWPAEFDGVVLRALEKDRDLRFQSAADLRAELKRLSRGTSSPTVAVPAAAPAKPKPTGLIAGAALGLIAAAAGGWWLTQSRNQPMMTDRDIIVLAEIGNSTGDGMFDIAVKQALAVQVEQSPFLKALREDQVRTALRFMQKPPDTRLTPELARELCQREGLKAVLQGALSALGNRYLLTLEAVNCTTGDSLAQASAEAQGKEQVLEAVSKAVATMRGKLGESLASIQRTNASLEKATTGSLEAFQAYALGEQARAAGDWLGAIPHYERAVQTDPEFALAWARLGIVHSNTGEGEASRADLANAMKYVGRTGERERYYIQAHYYDKVVEDVEKSIEAWQAQSRLYPRDPTPLINLGVLYGGLGQSAKAIEASRAALRLDPRQVTAAGNLPSYLVQTGDWEEARRLARQAVESGRSSVIASTALWTASYLLGDAAECKRIEAQMSGQPEEYRLWFVLAQAALREGRFRQAAELRNRTILLLQRKKLAQNLANLYAGDAGRQALVGDCSGSRAAAAQAVAALPALAATSGIGVARALCGDAAGARAAIDAIRKRAPNGTRATQTDVPLVQTAMDLHDQRFQAALDALRPALNYEFTSPVIRMFQGRAYAGLKQHEQAAASFQAIVDARGRSVGWNVTWALAHLEAARSYAAAGQRDKARKLYDAFLDLWKNADPDLKVLADAKRERAALD